MLGRADEIHARRDEKLESARHARQLRHWEWTLHRAKVRQLAIDAEVGRLLTNAEVRQLAIDAANADNRIQPVKRKRALEASNPPGIAGWVCDEWSREAGNRLCLPTPNHHSEHSPMPQKTQASDGGDSIGRVTLLSNLR
jgi:hypothetical protein